jgi:hypothetical protein
MKKTIIAAVISMLSVSAFATTVAAHATAAHVAAPHVVSKAPAISHTKPIATTAKATVKNHTVNGQAEGEATAHPVITTTHAAEAASGVKAKQ